MPTDFFKARVVKKNGGKSWRGKIQNHICAIIFKVKNFNEIFFFHNVFLKVELFQSFHWKFCFDFFYHDKAKKYFFLKMSEKVLRQGAEAKLFIGTYKGQQCIIKERFSKKYRIEEIDKSLTKTRINGEKRTSERCQKAGILCPKIFHVDMDERKIYMEYFEHAITVKDFIIEIEEESEKLKELTKRIGHAIGKMHANNIIHGDLTTSNLLVNRNENDYDLIMIDFGLSSYSMSNEDKGVDLYVLERALISTHSTLPHLFDDIIVFYKETNPKSEEIIKKFEEVRARGRKRTMIG